MIEYKNIVKIVEKRGDKKDIFLFFLRNFEILISLDLYFILRKKNMCWNRVMCLVVKGWCVDVVNCIILLVLCLDEIVVYML